MGDCWAFWIFCADQVRLTGGRRKDPAALSTIPTMGICCTNDCPPAFWMRTAPGPRFENDGTTVSMPPVGLSRVGAFCGRGSVTSCC